MMFNTFYGSVTGIRATIRPPGTGVWRKVKRLAARAMTERVRNAAILIYMVGNALTFTKILAAELAGLQGTGEVGGKIVKVLLLSLVWPLYWIGSALFG